MRKGAYIFLAVMLLVCFIFAACSAKDKNEVSEASSEYADGLDDSANEYGFETENVTDKSGKEVTDANGEPQTTQVAVVYTKDKKGKYIAQKLDANGEPVTNKKKQPVTVKSDYANQLNTTVSGTTDAITTQKSDNTTTTSTGKNTEEASTTKPQSVPSSTTSNNTSDDATKTTTTKANTTKANTTKANTTKATTTKATTTKATTTKANTTKTQTTAANVEITKEADTTKFTDKESVPKTSATGRPVKFSETAEKNDVKKVESMLEVPYLYLASYENSDGVPTEIAAYTAVWMAQLNGETSSVYPSSPVVLNLFKFYGQTVVNFKTKCNSVENSPIEYDNKNDTFTIKKFPEKKQSVTITRIEDLGNNNFYKITGSVSNAGDYSTVVAIIQKNKLESKLGFSIKAIKWS